MMDELLKLEIALGSELMTTVRLATGGICSASGLDVDVAEDCKVCVTESLLLLSRRGFSAASVAFRKELSRLFVFILGKGSATAEQSDEDEISLALLAALAEDFAMKAGEISFSFGI